MCISRYRITFVVVVRRSSDRLRRTRWMATPRRVSGPLPAPTTRQTRHRASNQGPLTWATLRVLRAVLCRFHNADGTGRCFPGHELIAVAAKCHRDTVCEALKALEAAGLLTWCWRITRIGHRGRDLLGDWGMVWQTIRTSNAYRLIDPLDREPGRKGYKSENPTGPQNLDFKRTQATGNFHQRGGARLDAAQAIQDLLGKQSSGTALGSWSSAAEVATALLRNPRAPT